jgi:hypothetical protein
MYGEPSWTGNKDFLRKRIAWRIHALPDRGCSPRTATALHHHVYVGWINDGLMG